MVLSTSASFYTIPAPSSQGPSSDPVERTPPKVPNGDTPNFEGMFEMIKPDLNDLAPETKPDVNFKPNPELDQVRPQKPPVKLL
jgi:hypothetical protein